MIKDFVKVDPMDEGPIIVPITVKYDFFFHQDIDKEALLDAAKKMRECYDLLQVRIVLHENQIHFIKHELPVKLLLRKYSSWFMI